MSEAFKDAAAFSGTSHNKRGRKHTARLTKRSVTRAYESSRRNEKKVKGKQWKEVTKQQNMYFESLEATFGWDAHPHIFSNLPDKLSKQRHKQRKSSFKSR